MNTRDLGLNYGAGKGDKPRSKFDQRWVENFSEINWGDPVKRAAGFEKKKKKKRGRTVKRY